MSDESAGDSASPPAVSKDDRSVPPWLSRAIALAAGWVVLLFAAYWALGRLRTLLVMVLVAFFLSLAMEPAVDHLARRGWRRGSATALGARWRARLHARLPGRGGFDRRGAGQ